MALPSCKHITLYITFSLVMSQNYTCLTDKRSRLFNNGPKLNKPFFPHVLSHRIVYFITSNENTIFRCTIKIYVRGEASHPFQVSARKYTFGKSYDHTFHHDTIILFYAKQHSKIKLAVYISIIILLTN